MKKPEEHRKKWALGLSITLSALIFSGWAFYRGFVSFGGGSVFAEKERPAQVATIVKADSAVTPFENTKETFGVAFQEIGKRYQELKDSLSAVFVPFITGIEVYERK